MSSGKDIGVFCRFLSAMFGLNLVTGLSLGSEDTRGSLVFTGSQKGKDGFSSVLYFNLFMLSLST